MKFPLWWGYENFLELHNSQENYFLSKKILFWSDIVSSHFFLFIVLEKSLDLPLIYDPSVECGFWVL